MAGFPILDKLKEARRLCQSLEWCRGEYARTKDGRTLGSRSLIYANEDELLACCLTAFVDRATPVHGVTGLLIYRRLFELIQPSLDPDETPRESKREAVQYWNDSVAKSKDDVLALLDQAIAIEEKENEAYEATQNDQKHLAGSQGSAEA